METRSTQLMKQICAIFAALIVTLTVYSQAPLFKFQNATLISGTDKQVNATYRFPSVIVGVDALVKITAISGGIQLLNIDRTADGYSEAFQPEYNMNASSNGYIDFKITFVVTATNIALSQALVDATGIDIDGYDYNNGQYFLKEMNMIDMGGGTYSYNTFYSEIGITTTGTAFTATNLTGNLYGALVDTASTAVMYTVTASNVSSFTYRVGANNGLPASQGRYASLYFKRFTYPAYALALPKLQNFQGNLSNGHVNLNWDFSTTEGISQCILERQEPNSKSYHEVAYFMYTGEQTPTRNQYSDNISAGVYYYRLKMVGVDGVVKYSSTLIFQDNSQAKTNTLRVFPTLVRDQFTAQLKTDRSEQAQLNVVDYSGKIVDKRIVDLQQGMNNISVTNLQTAKGSYVVTLYTRDGSYAQKIVVQ
jgi:hypothetical protein